MVFLSEYAVAVASLLIFSVYNIQMFNRASSASDFNRTADNHAPLITFSLLLTYAATRMLLEDESPQAVTPVFLAVLFVMADIVKNGKHHAIEWINRISTMLLVASCLVSFIFFKGLNFLAQIALLNKLDRQIQWYHVFFIWFSSWRWFFISFITALPVYTPTWGLLVMTIKIVLMWVFYAGSGTSVAASPWGSLDEILLERNALLSLIISLITIVIIADQLAAIRKAYDLELIKATGKNVEPRDWGEFKTAISSSFEKVRHGNFVAAFYEYFPYLNEKDIEDVLVEVEDTKPAYIEVEDARDA